LFGSLMALRTFHTEGKLDWVAAAKIVVPATLGSAVGVWAAETIRNRQMGLVITAAVLMALLMLFTKLKAALARDRHETPRITSLGLFVLFFVGVWLGFIVLDGATYLLLVLILLFQYDLPHAKCSQGIPSRYHHLGADRDVCTIRQRLVDRGSPSFGGQPPRRLLWCQALESRESSPLGIPHPGDSDRSRTDPSRNS
jgi:Sulfite exporter TauE/SafE